MCSSFLMLMQPEVVFGIETTYLLLVLLLLRKDRVARVDSGHPVRSPTENVNEEHVNCQSPDCGPLATQLITTIQVQTPA